LFAAGTAQTNPSTKTIGSLLELTLGRCHPAGQETQAWAAGSNADPMANGFGIDHPKL
jgi:hypothetical protein